MGACTHTHSRARTCTHTHTYTTLLQWNKKSVPLRQARSQCWGNQGNRSCILVALSRRSEIPSWSNTPEAAAVLAIGESEAAGHFPKGRMCALTKGVHHQWARRYWGVVYTVGLHPPGLSRGLWEEIPSKRGPVHPWLPALLVSPSQLLLPLSGRYCSLLCEINCLNHLCLSVDQFILSRRKSQGNIDLLTLPKPQEDGVEGPRKLLSAVCLRHSCYTSLSLIPSQSGPSLDWPATSCLSAEPRPACNFLRYPRTQAGLEAEAILCFWLQECWDYRHGPAGPATPRLFTKSLENIICFMYLIFK